MKKREDHMLVYSRKRPKQTVQLNLVHKQVLTWLVIFCITKFELHDLFGEDKPLLLLTWN